MLEKIFENELKNQYFNCVCKIISKNNAYIIYDVYANKKHSNYICDINILKIYSNKYVYLNGIYNGIDELLIIHNVVLDSNDQDLIQQLNKYPSLIINGKYYDELLKLKNPNLIIKTIVYSKNFNKPFIPFLTKYELDIYISWLIDEYKQNNSKLYLPNGNELTQNMFLKLYAAYEENNYEKYIELLY